MIRTKVGVTVGSQGQGLVEVVGVKVWVKKLQYAYESPHKSTSMSVCVSVCVSAGNLMKVFKSRRVLAEREMQRLQDSERGRIKETDREEARVPKTEGKRECVHS